MEHTAGHLTKGEYKVALPDGRIQVVSYEAVGFFPLKIQNRKVSLMDSYEMMRWEQI